MNTQPKIRILLVDDHFVVRLGLAGSLNIEPDMEVVAECGSGEKALTLFAEYKPDVTVMDGRLPGMNGMETTRAILKDAPDAKIIMLSAMDAEEDIYAAVQSGICAYLPKAVEREELVAGIRKIFSGERYFPKEILGLVEARKGHSELTAREQEVLRLIVLGRSNKEIGLELGIAGATVKLHVGNLLEKLGALDRLQAATIAIKRGLVHLD
ncbi:MAG: response regulator transcription factor [Verrucomicrobiota bacterium]